MSPSPLPAEARQRIQEAVSREGLAAFVVRSKSSEKAVLRALGGLPVRAGTALLLEAAVESSAA